MHLLTQSALLQALGWSLFKSLWQMGLFWLLYQLFILVFRESAARIRHGLALLLLSAGTLWSVLDFVFAYYFFRDGNAFLLRNGGATFGYTGSGASISMARSLIAEIIPCVSSLYLLVVSGLLFRYCFHYYHSIQLTRTGLTRTNPGFRVFVDQTSRQMGIRPAVGVWLSSLVKVPVTLGFLKPVILLPLAMVANLTPTQVEAILVHELAHVRRKDFLLNLWVTMLEGVFFFNPFTRGLIAQLRKEREHCCDDQVLQFRYDPQNYVSALLSIARQAAAEGQESQLVVAATGSGNNKLLLQRAKRILQKQKTDDRPGPWLFAVLFLTALVAMVTLQPPASRVASTAAATPPATTSSPTTASSTTTTSIASTVSPATTGSSAKSHPNVPKDQSALSTPPYPRSSRRTAPPPNTSMTQPATAPDQEAPLPLLNAVADADEGMPEELVAITNKDTREYSISKSHPGKLPRTEKNEEGGQPFVPNSSFSFQLIDTLRPEEKLARLKEQTQLEILYTIRKLQLDIAARQDLLSGLPDKQTSKQQQQVLDRQLHLQQEYLQKIQQLQKKLNQLQRHITIVYI